MFQYKQVFSKSDVTNYAVNMSDQIFNMEKKNFFWTKQQLNLIERDEKRVLFTSEFGTGKTTVLKAKAKKLAIQREFLKNSETPTTFVQSNTDDPGKTFIILFTQSNSLLTESIQNEFQKLKTHVEVISFDAKSEQDLTELVKANSKCNFFLDEVLVSKNVISATTIASISNIIKAKNAP